MNTLVRPDGLSGANPDPQYHYKMHGRPALRQLPGFCFHSEHLAMRLVSYLGDLVYIDHVAMEKLSRRSTFCFLLLV